MNLKIQALNQTIREAQQDTAEIINELLEDGSDPDAIYLIEHHISGQHFEQLEKAVIEAFKLGFEVEDPEEIDGEPMVSCDLLSEVPLNEDLINQQIAQIVALCDQFDLEYDGWGTYFEDGDDYDDSEEDEESSENDHPLN